MISPLPVLLFLLPTALTAVSARRDRGHGAGTWGHRPPASGQFDDAPNDSTAFLAPTTTAQVTTGTPTGSMASPLQVQARRSSAAGTWSLREMIVGHDFLDAFNFETFDDPTEGDVDYVDASTAASMNLMHATDTSFILRADSFSVVGEGERGRKSVRLASKITYANGAVVFDLKHMPTGCGTWPAFWTVGTDWQADGEIDIIEGVNTDVDNVSSLHTSDGCTMPKSGTDMLGEPVNSKCGTADGDESGCNVSFALRPNSFGAAFNSNGGGAYAMSRSSESVKIWFWPAGTIPEDVSSGAATVDESTWGTPSAVFPSSDQCSIEEHFKEHHVVINLTFCGAMGTEEYGRSGCPGTCSDYVRDNPSAFNDAFFEINSLRTYS